MSEGAIQLGMVGDEWHGPTAPGPGWVLTGKGRRGGKIWKKTGQAGKQPAGDIPRKEQPPPVETAPETKAKEPSPRSGEIGGPPLEIPAVLEGMDEAIDPALAAGEYKEKGTHAASFKAWFGDWEKDPGGASKVVKPDGSPAETAPASLVRNAAGIPIPVYHGTPYNPFDVFDKKKIADPEKLAYGPGFYFSDDRDVVEKYIAGATAAKVKKTGSGHLFVVYLNVRKPFDGETGEVSFSSLPAEAQKRLGVYLKKFGATPPADIGYVELTKALGSKEAANSFLAASGYDGISHAGKNSQTNKPYRNWIAFEPNQIKSVGNKGTFDATSDNINLSLSKEMEGLGPVAMGMVGDEWHGPAAPGPGWVLAGEGERGGKIWRKGAGGGKVKAVAKKKKQPSFYAANALTSDEIRWARANGHLESAADLIDQDRVDLIKSQAGEAPSQSLPVQAAPRAEAPASAQTGTPIVQRPDDLLAGALLRSGLDLQSAEGQQAYALMEELKAKGRIATTQEEVNLLVEEFATVLSRLQNTILQQALTRGTALSMQRASWFATLLLRALPESESLDEALEATEVALAVQLGMVGDEWHGPQAPGPGWVQTGTGRRGGKVWRKGGSQKQEADPWSQAHASGEAPEANYPAKAMGQMVAGFIDRGQLDAAKKLLLGRVPKGNLHEVLGLLSPAQQQAIGYKAQAAQPPQQQAAPAAQPDVSNPVLQQFIGPPEPAGPGISGADIADSFERLQKASGAAGGIVKIPELYDEIKKKHPSLTIEDFHAYLIKLGKDDKLSLQLVNDPRLEPRIKEMFHSNQGWLGYVAMQPYQARGLRAQLSLEATFSHDLFSPRAQKILDRALAEMKKFSASAYADLRRALEAPSVAEVGQGLVDFIRLYRSRLATLLGRTALASLLEGAMQVAESLPPMPASPVSFTPLHPEDDTFSPVVDDAVRALQEKNVLDKWSYDLLDEATRQKYFTVAGVESRETLEKIRDALTEGTEGKLDLPAFKERVLESVDTDTFLSDAKMEQLYRDTINAGWSDGQMKVLSHPYVRGGFPYASYDPIDDSRVRDDHLALEKLGIDGSNIYRINDPVFQKFRPPWSYNCRCSWTAMTTRQAAEAGIKEATEWLKTGVEPSPPAFVAMPPFEPPPEFRRDLSSLPLSIQLALTPLEDWQGRPRGPDGRFVTILPSLVLRVRYQSDPPGPGWTYEGEGCWSYRGDGEDQAVSLLEKEMEELGPAAMGMVGNEWHGPEAPGPGWVEIKEGERGGKVWKKQGGGGQEEQPPSGQKPQLSPEKQQKFDQYQKAAQESAADPNNAVNRLKGQMAEIRTEGLPAIQTIRSTQDSPLTAQDHEQVAEFHMRIGQMLQLLGKQDLADANLSAWSLHKQAARARAEPPEQRAAREYRELGTRAPAFKKWFGDWEKDPDNASKVVTPTGEPEETSLMSRVMNGKGQPVAVYHGTPWNEFDVFDRARLANAEDLLYGAGFYFTDSKEIVQTYQEKGSGVSEPPPSTLKLPPREAARALRDLLKAELPRLQQEHDDAEKGLKDVQQRYHELLNSGASDAVLDEKKAEIDAAWNKRYDTRAYLDFAGRYRGTYVSSRSVEKNVTRFAETFKKILGDKMSDIVDSHKGHTFEAYLNIRNPFDTREDSVAAEDLPEGVRSKIASRRGFAPARVTWDDIYRGLGSKKATNELLASLGYDGLTHEGHYGARAGQTVPGVDTHRAWIAFEPNQIKSVGNRGTFDPAQASIKMSLGDL